MNKENAEKRSDEMSGYIRELEQRLNLVFERMNQVANVVDVLRSENRKLKSENETLESKLKRMTELINKKQKNEIVEEEFKENVVKLLGRIDSHL